jgi:hypothetical protein
MAGTRKAFAETEYQAAVAKYQAEWSTLDSVHYRLCREYPHHTELSSVFAKVLIIGRTYSTGVQRQLKKGETISEVAKLFVDQHKTMDNLLAALPSVRERLDGQSLRSVVEVHGHVVALLKPITRRSRSTRAFVAKYLHFHNPIVPIYDSYANSNLTALRQWTDAYKVFEEPENADREYMWYVMRLLSLFNELINQRLQPTVRHLDYYLLTMGD